MLIKATTAAAFGAVALFAATGCGGANPDEVASKVGATSCNNSGWYIENRFTGDKQTIYDCTINGSIRCVTYSGGVAEDETEYAKFFFEDVLSTDRPSCVEEG